MRKSGVNVFSLALPLRPLLLRLTIALLLTFSCALVILSKTDSQFTTNLRAGITTVMVPALDVLSRPFDAASDFGSWVGELVTLRAENLQLKGQNAELMRWQLVAREMEAENRSLRNLLQFTAEQKLSYTTARIVTDTSGPFVKTALINAGSLSGIDRHEPVLSDRGLIGRIVDVAPNNARVLLITDINSRIPVMTENSREKSVLAGNNTDLPQLLYLPEDSKAQVGERIVTAGDGKLLPAGIPVGVVRGFEHGTVTVQPLVDWARLELVSVAHFQF